MVKCQNVIASSSSSEDRITEPKRSKTTLLNCQSTTYRILLHLRFSYDEILSKTTINLLSSSVITIIGSLTFPSPFKVEANTVML